MPQRAKNAGVTGLIDLPGTGVKFQVRLYAFDLKQVLGSKSRAGRGGGKWPASRALLATGNFVASGKVRLDGYPQPNAWKGQAGTLTLQAHTSKTVSVAVRVVAMTYAFNERTEDFWDVTIACEVTSTPTFSGWGGSQTAATDPTPSDLELWQGTSKTYDPSGLQTAAVRAIDIWGNLADTDAAEESRLSTVVAAAVAPLTGLQVRRATFQRDSDDGGTMILEFGLSTTAQDVTLSADTAMYGNVMPGSWDTPSIVSSTDSAQAIALAAWTAKKDDLALEGISVRKLTPGKALKVEHWRQDQRLTAGEVVGVKQVARVANNSGTLQVYLGKKLSAGSGLWWARIDPVYVNKCVMRFSLRKRVTTSSGAVDLHLELIDNTNNAEFLGFAVGTVKYLGCRPMMNMATTAERVAEMEYFFLYDSQGHYDETGIQLGWTTTTTDLSGTSVGWVAAATLGGSASFLTQDDFSGFLGSGM